jgi:alcohol dehydrogenase (cytochrome c)
MSCAVLFYLRRLLPLLLISGSGGALPAFAAGPSQSELDAGGKAADSWLMTNKSYDGRRYVDLRQIEPGNVTQLKEVCTFDSRVAAPAQSAPLLYEGRIYFSVGATTLAIDAATCREIWRHEWTLKGKALSNPNRGVAIKEGRVVRGTRWFSHCARYGGRQAYLGTPDHERPGRPLSQHAGHDRR